jgi:hypothetical protein
MSIPVIQPEDNDIFSFRFIFSTARRYWLWILAAALLGGTGSYFIFARQGYLYEKTARIMLRDDKQKNSQVSEIILSDLGVRAEEANLANESYVVQSSEVMGRVVKGLELGVSYWEERNIRKVELYHTTPLKVEFGEEVDFQPCSLAVTPCRGQEHDSGSLLRIGQQQKFRIIAENMKTFFHEGTAVYDDERQLLALLPGKQRKFPCKRQAHQTDKVILIFHLGIQRVRNHQR